MKTPCPLHYNAADVMAAFSRDCDPAPSPMSFRPETFGASLVRGTAAASVRWLSALDEGVRSGLGRLRLSAVQRSSGRIEMSGGPDLPKRDHALADHFAAPAQPGLTSHYALVGTIE